MTDTERELRELADQLSKRLCAHFPNKICNEVPGLDFYCWCDPCRARAVVNAFEIAARRRMVLLA